MRTLIGTLLAFTFAVSAFAFEPSDYIFFDQPSPDSRTFITATVNSGVICSQGPPTVTVSGSKIVIEATWLTGICITGSFPVTAKIGILPGGVYEVVGKNLAREGDVMTKLVVRGVDPIRVYPPGGTTAGGTKIELWYDHELNGGYGISVSIDGIPVPPPAAGAEHATCVAPPHPPGDVDIALSFIDARGVAVATYVTRAAYRYFDPSAAPDPFLFQRLLFPVQYENGGAVGSRWATDSSIAATRTRIPGFVEFREPPCSGCPRRIDPAPAPEAIPAFTFPIDKRNSVSGALLYVFRGTEEAMITHSRVRAVGATSHSAGTEVPVVLERDFRSSVQLLGIPADPAYRVMLRVWALKDLRFQRISATLHGSKSIDVPLEFSRSTVDALPFASADLTSLLGRLAAAPLPQLHLLSPDATNGIWAMVSITNNETQEVTIVTPR